MQKLATLMLSIAVGVTTSPAWSHEYMAGKLEITHPWARATGAAQRNGAAYMTIHNRGEEPDRLLAVRTGEAQGTELHGTTVTAEGVAQMRAVEAVVLQPGTEAKLAPVGIHVMLIGLTGPLYEGVSFPMTLVFERAGEVGVEVEIMDQGTNATVDHGEEGTPHGAGHKP